MKNMGEGPTFNPRYRIDNLGFDFLSNDPFGRPIVEEVRRGHEERLRLMRGYLGRVNVTDALDVFGDPAENQPFPGANIFALFTVDELARNSSGGRVRAALPAESELFLAHYPSLGQGTWRPVGAVLDCSGYNHPLALHVHGMLKREDQDLGRLPAVLSSLVARPFRKAHGIALEVSYPYEMITAETLSHGIGYFRMNDPGLLKEGVPSEVTRREQSPQRGIPRNHRLLDTKPQVFERSYEVLGLSMLSLGCHPKDQLRVTTDIAKSDPSGRILLVSQYI